MKKVCIFNYPATDEIEGYHIETFDPLKYFNSRNHWPFSDFILWGLNGYYKQRALTAGTLGVDRLYRERDPDYMRMANDFVDKFKDFDAIVMSAYCFIHPEIMENELKKPIKILGCIDDPPATYSRTLPNLWAFDGAFYISPSYMDNIKFEEALERWGCRQSTWWPLVPFPFQKPTEIGEKFFRNRDVDILYVGTPSATKADRLAQLKKYFGERLRVHGRWPFKGYAGIIRGLFGKPIYPHRVTSLSNDERTQLYWRTKIGLNMHYSDIPSETGNMRMYEAPAHGTMMICDKGCANGHEQIFTPNQEAVYYDGIDDAIELIEYYLAYDDERISIAQAGFERYWKDYEWKCNLKRFLDWTVSLRSAAK